MTMDLWDKLYNFSFVPPNYDKQINFFILSKETLSITDKCFSNHFLTYDIKVKNCHKIWYFYEYISTHHKQN